VINGINPGASVTHNAGSDAVRSIHNRGTLVVNGGSTLSVARRYVQTAGSTVVGGGTLVVGRLFDLRGGTLSDQGPAAGPGAVVGNVRNAATVRTTNAAVLTLTGVYTQAAEGTLEVAPFSTLILPGPFTNLAAGTLTGGTYLVGGHLRLPAGASIMANAANLVFEGGDISDLEGGSPLRAFTGNTADGSLTVRNNSDFRVDEVAESFTNAGCVSVEGGGNSSFFVPGVYRQFGGSTTLGGGAPLRVNGLLDLQGGVVTGPGDIIGNVRNAALISTDIDTIRGLLTINGAYTETPAGTLAVIPGSTLSLNGTFTNFSGQTLTGGTYQIGGTLRFPNANIVTNAATIVLDGPAAWVVDQSGNDGLAGLAVNDAAGSLLLVDGAGRTTTGAFSNRGFLSVGPGSVFAVNGDYTQGPLATLEVQLGGTPDTGLFGQLRVRDRAALDGTLVLTPVGRASALQVIASQRLALVTPAPIGTTPP
jgi:hypothetical protein